MTSEETKLKKGGTLTVYKAGTIYKHKPTPPRPFNLKYETPSEDDPLKSHVVILQSRTSIIGAAVDYVRLAVRTLSPREVCWLPGTEEAEAAYRSLQRTIIGDDEQGEE